MTYARNRLSTNTQLGCVVGVGCLLLLFLNCELKVKLMNINFTTYYTILTNYNPNIFYTTKEHYINGCINECTYDVELARHHVDITEQL